ncbi:four-carbon acid sugar kinase family protein, partial [Raoultella planticola]|uniref:four-carbon acid sugar kinase family protein n=1 Tax=Raoultella planticola TaxID=575 RepID=UPI0024168E16
PTRDLPLTSEAVVISLKTRSCPAEMAVSQSLAALRWLQAQGCQQFYFKYCSTFDSTAQGNIGPVLDALLAELGETRTVISPALPVNGRTVYQGYLFVGAHPPSASPDGGASRTHSAVAHRRPGNSMLVQHPQVKHWLIVGMNDNTVLGGVRATEGQGFKAPDVIGIGINGVDAVNE